MTIYSFVASGSHKDNKITQCYNPSCSKGKGGKPKVFAIKSGVSPILDADTGKKDEDGDNVLCLTSIPFCSFACLLTLINTQGEC